MLTIALVIAIAAVPLFGGSLRKLAQLRFRGTWMLVAALAVQIVLFGAEGPQTTLKTAAHFGSYLLAFAFLYRNRGVRGIWLIGLGAALNLIAITANGGIMPAAAHALATAGLPVDTVTVFENSAALPDPNLLVLGDIFALPKSIPAANVFSVGDLLIVLGAAVTIHRATGSRLVPEGQGEFGPVVRDRTFLRLWGAQIVSSLGDWVYAIAVALLLADRVDGPDAVAVLATLLVVQYVPSAVFGALFAGPLVDRRSRRTLMIAADLARAVAIASLLLAGEPDLLHFYAVALVLGIFGAIFQPALLSTVPNIVRRDRVLPAQSLIGATSHIAIVAGPAIGGFLVARYAAGTVFAVNAATFVLSALLIATVPIAGPAVRALAPGPRFADVRRGLRYVASNPLTRGIIVVLGLVSLGAATKAPLEPLYVRDVLADGALETGGRIFGLITAAWGLGMVLGSVTAPGIARRWARERLLPISIAVVGCAVLVVSRTDDFSTVLFAWLVAGWANALGNVSYETLLQERTPDEFRGRVFAAIEAVSDSAFVAGALIAVAVGAALAVQDVLAIAGGVMLIGAAAGIVLLPRPAPQEPGGASGAPPERSGALPPPPAAGPGAPQDGRPVTRNPAPRTL
ncbi:MAG: MFS transporter [Actinomycetota bacterium]